MKRIGMLMLLLLGATAVAVAQSNQASLGDVARQAKPTKKAARVITNEDIPSRPEEVAQPAAGSSSGSGAPSDATKDGGATSDTKADAKEKPAGKDDSPEVAAMKGRLKEVQSDELNLESAIKDIEANIAKEQDSERRDVLYNMLANRKKSLESRKAEKAELRAKIDQAEHKDK